MIGNIIFALMFAGILALLACALKPRKAFLSKAREDRYRTCQRLRMQCRMERQRTKIVTPDKSIIIGDGACPWQTVKAEYPKAGV